jgi:hypothetical protein
MQHQLLLLLLLTPTLTLTVHVYTRVKVKPVPPSPTISPPVALSGVVLDYYATIIQRMLFRRSKERGHRDS